MSTRAPARAPARTRPRWRFPYGGPGKFEPFPKQALAHRTFADEVLFGGAAGPGKTDWLIGEHVTHALEVPGSASVLFRRTFPDLNRPQGIIRRLLDRIPREVATYNMTEHIWTFRNGSLLELAHLERDSDVLKYQGAEYTLVGFDELTQFTEWQYLYMLSRQRSAGELRDRLAAMGLRPRTIAASNPGGPGHGWVKARFIDPAPPFVVWRPDPSEDDPEPGTRCFIPARLEDNPALDPGYEARLNRLPEDERRALREGDWDVFAGQRFKEFRRSIHVIEPEDYPIPTGGVTRGCAVDYGLDAPFCALWGVKGPDGLIVVYRELYEAGLTPKEQARKLLGAEARGERTPQRPIPVAIDPATWARQPGETKDKGTRTRPPKGSIAGIYRAEGVPVVRANNDRLLGVAAVAGKLRVRPDGRPRLLIYSNCTNLIRTLPTLVRDPRRPEDVDTSGEDHAYDTLRYLIALLEQRPSGDDPTRPPPGPQRPRFSSHRDRAESERDPQRDRGRTLSGALRRHDF